MKKTETRHVSEIIKERLAQSGKREAQARGRLIQQGVLEPGEELILPASLREALRTRRGSTY